MPTPNEMISTLLPEKELLPPFRFVSLVDYPPGCGGRHHVHDCFQTVLVLSGEFLMSGLDGRALRLGEGELLVVPPGSPHNWGADAPCRTFQVSSEPMLPEDFGELSELFGSGRKDWTRLSLPKRSFKAAQRSLMSELELSRPGGSALFHASLLSLFALALRVRLERTPREEPSSSGEEVFKRAAEFIRANYRRRVTLAELAASSFLGVSRFSELFSLQAGASPMKYLAKYRMERARGLLLYSDLSVSETARHLGFSSVHYFSKAFKRRFGHEPSTLLSRRKQAPAIRRPPSSFAPLNRKK